MVSVECTYIYCFISVFVFVISTEFRRSWSDSAVSCRDRRSCYCHSSVEKDQDYAIFDVSKFIIFMILGFEPQCAFDVYNDCYTRRCPIGDQVLNSNDLDNPFYVRMIILTKEIGIISQLDNSDIGFQTN